MTSMKRPGETVPVAELKRDFAEYVDNVRAKGQRYLIGRRGKPVTALVSVEDL